MAITRMSLKDAQANRPSVDRAKIVATTEADIERQMVEDGEDPDAADNGDACSLSPAAVRKQLKMTQERFAAAIRVPLATLRSWEQGRVQPEPAARALLIVLAKEPEAALRALARE